MSIQQCAQAVVQVIPHRTVTMPDGLTLPLRVAFVAIAGRESAWNVKAPGDAYGSCPSCYHPVCNGYTSFGYFQVHFAAWATYLQQVTGSTDPCQWKAWLQHPHNSAVAAWHLYQTAQHDFGNGFQPWWPDVAGAYAAFPHVTSHNPPYRAYLQQARQAVAAAERAQPTPTPTKPPATSSPPLLWVPWALMGLGVVASFADVAVIHDRATGRWW